jgi:formate hydrogenlyase transcriptional activator
MQLEQPLAARYEALIRVSQAVSAHREPQSLFSTLAGELRQVVPFDFIGVAQYDETTGQATWLLSECDRPCQDGPADCGPEREMTRWVYEHQQALVIPSVQRETRFPEMTEKLTAFGVQSACGLPLTTVHRRVGILALGSRRPNAFSEDEVRFLSLVADQVALAIDDAFNLESSQRAQAELREKREELQRERDRLTLLLDVNNTVASLLDLKELLRGVSASVRRVMQCDIVGVYSPHAESGQLHVYAADFGETRGFFREEVVVPIEGTLPGKVFRTGKAVIAEQLDPNEFDVESYKRLAGEGIRSGCLIPLISKNRVLGVLGLGRRQGAQFTQEDIAFLSQIANQCAIAVENAVAYGQIADLKDKLAQEKLYLEDEIRSELNFEEIVGTSTTLRRVLKQVETVAPTESTVMIYGETGTGKELIARAVHNLSRRRSDAFVKLNCAAIPTGLLESELFGHEKGAFTGAIAQRIGRFELASRGTVFLDEIGEIPLELQPKLLRVLQEREFERLGSSRTLRSDARLIAATNRDLAAMVEEGKFRSDLFYRLNVFPVHIPSLRERPDDIPLLVRHFAEQFARRMNKVIESIPSETMNALCDYHWPGNIRELQNVIERAVILSPGPVLQVAISALKPRPSAGATPAENGDSRKHPAGQNIRSVLEETERKHILSVLDETGWVVAGPEGAAVRLGMKRSTLQLRMQKLGISRRKTPRS